MKHIEITKALRYLTPNAEWSLTGDNFDDIIWLDSQEQPSKEEIEKTIAEIAKLEAEKAKIEADLKVDILQKLGITADEAALLLK